MEGPEINIGAVGVDLAKHVFQIHAVDERWHSVSSKRLSRSRMIPFFICLSPWQIGMGPAAARTIGHERSNQLGIPLS